jgi:hypothetical protein
VDTNPKRETVAGIFEDRQTAARALEKLTEAHFDIEADASVIVSHHGERKRVPIMSDVPALTGALIGVAAGVLIAAIIVVASGLDVGPFSMERWGPLWAWFETAYAGAAIGVATGVMMSFEFAHPKAAFHLAGFEGGVVWVGIRASGARADHARQILAGAGAKHFMDHAPELAAA